MSAYELIMAAAPQLQRVPTEHDQVLLEHYLADRFASARRACPGITVDEAVFWPYVAVRLPPTKRTLDALGELHFNDLYVACACQAGDARALARIDKRHLPAAFLGVERLVGDAARVAALKQVLRRQLFVVERGRTPKISGYLGHESLVTWLRTVVHAAAAEMLRRDRDDARR